MLTQASKVKYRLLLCEYYETWDSGALPPSIHVGDPDLTSHLPKRSIAMLCPPIYNQKLREQLVGYNCANPAKSALADVALHIPRELWSYSFVRLIGTPVDSYRLNGVYILDSKVLYLGCQLISGGTALEVYLLLGVVNVEV